VIVLPEALLDTDILLDIMKGRDPELVRRAGEYLKDYPSFTISIITRYEVLRGLKVRAAVQQLLMFEEWCQSNMVLGLTDDIIVRASEIYGDLHRVGRLISDADILIAATALAHGLELITANGEHFQRIAGLQMENWRTAT
jgi:tRNA(fMet)-specific endonuclease VapC